MNVVPSYDENAFSKDVISRWGSLSEDLADDENLLHPQMAALARLCLHTPQICDDILRFLESILGRKDAISEIENAVAISFLQWPELKSVTSDDAIAPTVASVVRTQWERFGSNS